MCVYKFGFFIIKMKFLFKAKRRIAEEEKKKQEQEDAKLAERLQADENKRDTHTTTPHLLNTVYLL